MNAVWAPPKKVKPINARAYAVLRMYIEGGCKAAEVYEKRKAEGCADHCMPATTPSLTEMTDFIYAYVPASLIPGFDDDLDRVGYGTFALGRAKLLAALDTATAPTVLAEVHKPEGAKEGDLNWWVYALSAAGALAWLGKRNWAGATVSAVASRVFLALAAGGALDMTLEAAKEYVGKPLGEAARKAIGWLPIVAGAAVGAGLLWLALRKDKS